MWTRRWICRTFGIGKEERHETREMDCGHYLGRRRRGISMVFRFATH
jgi:hypothetical protein